MTNIVAGIVLYNPDIDRLEQNIKAAKLQVGEVVLFDNGSRNIKDVIHMLHINNLKCILLEEEQNMGIAYALNKIASWSIENKYDWLLTLDQDTVISSGLVKEYCKYLKLPRVGQLCCNFIDRNTGREEYNDFKSNSYSEIDKWITSGSLINLAALKKIGGFDEKLFIDYVDFDVCFALRKYDFKNYIINFVGMLHEIGDRKEYKIGLKSIDVMNHNAIRHFYISRNEIIVYKRYPDETLPNMYVLQIKTMIKVILFESNKREKIKAIFKGTISGLSNYFIRDCYL